MCVDWNGLVDPENMGWYGVAYNGMLVAVGGRTALERIIYMRWEYAGRRNPFLPPLLLFPAL